MELAFYRDAAAVTGQSDETIESIQQRSPDSRCTVITNGVDPGRFEVEPEPAAAQLFDAESPVFLYAGLMGHAQRLEDLARDLEGLPDSVPGRLVLMGDGPCHADIDRYLASLPRPRTHLIPSQPGERIPGLLAAADVVVVALGQWILGAVPSKIYEAMGAAKPILFVGGGEGARRIESAGCGLIVEPGDRDGLRRAWSRLARDPALRQELGQRGREAAETVYNRDRIACTLDKVLREAIAS